MILKCVAGEEEISIMWHYHSSAYGDHHNGERTTDKLLQSSFYGQICLKTVSCMSSSVQNIKKQVISPRGMTFPLNGML